MKKVFISQPMKDRTEEEILKEREITAKKAIKFVYGEEDDVEIIDTYFKDFTGSKNEPLKFLARSLDLLAEAGIAVFAKRWDEARGCRIEHMCAEEYGIPIIEWSDIDE